MKTEYQKLYSFRRSKGLCVKCGAKSVENRIMCTICLDRAGRYAKKYYKKCPDKVKAAQKRNRLVHLEERKQYHREYGPKWRAKNKNRISERQHEFYAQARVQTIAHYSKGTMRCFCCGESTYEFLTIDHSSGGGTKHRKEEGIRGSRMYIWLRNNGYPDGFEVLCYNCNCGRNINKGVCPHKNVVLRLVGGGRK